MTSSSPSVEYQFREYTVRPEGHHRYLHPPVLELIRKYVPTGTRLLDAGCGNGVLAAKLADDYEICGFDLSESGIAAARQVCPQARFEVGSVYDDPAELFGGTFGAAVSLEVVEHVYNPHEFLARLNSAVEPGGILIMSTPYHGYLKNLVMAVTNKLDAHFHALQTGSHIKFWSRRTLSRLFADSGFDVLEFAGCGRAPLLWSSMILVGRRRSA